MHPIRKLASLPVGSWADLAEGVLTTLGIVAFVVGLLIMPSLGLSRGEFYGSLLALAAFMFLFFGAGQLAVIRDRLSSR